MLSATMGRVKGLLKNRALSASMLAIVCDIPQVRLAAALRGTHYTGSEEEARILSLTMRCLKIIEAVLPFTVEAGDGYTLRQIVNNGRDPEEIRQIVMLLLEPSHEINERSV